jgi:hypothetical protein
MATASVSIDLPAVELGSSSAFAGTPKSKPTLTPKEAFGDDIVSDIGVSSDA